MFRALNEPWMLAYALGAGAMVILTMERDIASARSYLEESIALFRRLGDEQNAAFPLVVLGELEYAAGNYERTWRAVGSRAPSGNSGTTARH